MTFRSEPRPPIERFVDGLVDFIANHWLGIMNTFWGIYVLLPLLAPFLMEVGLTGPARMIYAAYSFACHQLPDHSYFFFGEHLAPNLFQLEAGGMEPTANLLEQRHFHGNEVAGFKAAICQRDIAIYGAVFVGGLIFSQIKSSRGRINWKLYLLLLLPMAIDGTTQLIGLRESNWWLRSLTGALFGAASVWFAYPHIRDAMDETLVEQQLAESR